MDIIIAPFKCEDAASTFALMTAPCPVAAAVEAAAVLDTFANAP